VRWQRELCLLIERDVDDIVYVDVPLASLERFHASGGASPSDWRPASPGLAMRGADTTLTSRRCKPQITAL
jgi:hypothetical protein